MGHRSRITAARSPRCDLVSPIDLLNPQVYPAPYSEWQYDPREGFFVDEILIDAAGLYTCVAKRGALTKDVMAHIHVQRNASLCLFVFSFVGLVFS